MSERAEPRKGLVEQGHDGRGATGTGSAYEHRYLALIDVLGWSEETRASTEKPETLQRLKQAAEAMAGAIEWAESSNEVSANFDEFGPKGLDVRVSQFSDTVVISSPTGDGTGVPLTLMLDGIARRLLDSRYYVRGAIVRGLVHHTKTALYGPALLEAYELERSVAVYPRILVTPEAAPVFDKEFLRADLDGLAHLNFLRVWKGSDEELQYLEKLIAMVTEKEKEDSEKLGHLAKHRWFRKYVEDAIARVHDLRAHPPESFSGMLARTGRALFAEKVDTRSRWSSTAGGQ